MALFFFVLAGVLLVILAGLAHLYYALKHAVSGYEDNRGFHGGDPEQEEALTMMQQGMDAEWPSRPAARKKKASLVRSGRHG